MRRKVIQIANSTQLVSLPRKWALDQGIKKGDEVEVAVDGSTVVISTETGTKMDEIFIDVCGLTPRLADRLVTRAYQKGYDVLNIKYDSPFIIKAIQDKIQELIGFEIMDKSKSDCRIEIISSKLDINFDASFRRAFLTVIDMAQEASSGYGTNDESLVETLLMQDTEVNKFCYFCLRYINKGERHEFGNFALHYLIESLEDVGDELKILAKVLIHTKKKIPLISDLLNQINTMVKNAYDFYYKPDKEKALRGSELYSSIEAKVQEDLIRAVADLTN